MQRIPPELTSNACTMRRDATPAERALWRALRGSSPRFTRQLVVGHDIIDTPVVR
jgi:very-short-patch-repair endonuclease